MQHCPSCKYEYLDEVDYCPDCGEALVELDEPKNSGKRSWWPGIVFLIGAGAIKAIGTAMSGSAVDSANFQGTTDIVMVVLGLIGIAWIIHVAGLRSGTKGSK